MGSLAWHLSTNYFTNALREIFRRFECIEVDRLQLKPVVKITGEFYLQTVEGEPNYNIHSWLESEGARAEGEASRVVGVRVVASELLGGDGIAKTRGLSPIAGIAILAIDAPAHADPRSALDT